jgi:predicted DNA-binding transcriptional regulator AlpA
MDRLMTIDLAAERLCTSESTMRFWRHKGVGPPSAKFGRRIVYRESDLDAWIAAQFAAADSDRPTTPAA